MGLVLCPKTIIPEVHPHPLQPSATLIFSVDCGLGIGCQVDFARCDTGIQLSQPVTPVTKTLQYRIQIGHEEKVDAGIGRKRLIEPQMTSLPTVVSFLQQLQSLQVSVEHICARWEVVHSVHDQINIIESSARLS